MTSFAVEATPTIVRAICGGRSAVTSGRDAMATAAIAKLRMLCRRLVLSMLLSFQQNVPSAGSNNAIGDEAMRQLEFFDGGLGLRPEVAVKRNGAEKHLNRANFRTFVAALDCSEGWAGFGLRRRLLPFHDTHVSHR